MKLVDIRDLKSLDSNIVPVRVRLKVPIKKSHKMKTKKRYPKVNKARAKKARLAQQLFNSKITTT